MKGRSLVLAASALLLGACSADKLTVPNRNSPIPGDIDAPTSVRLQAAGALFQARANGLARVQDFMIHGREGFYYFPTDNRYTTGYLMPVSATDLRLNPASAFGRGAGLWNGGYRQLRNLHTLLLTSEGAGTLTDAQKAGVRGFANTLRALEVHYLLQSRDSLGVVLDIYDSPTAGIAPFVSRDSAYVWASAMLDSAAADLGRAGAAFSFASSLHDGFDGFDTPATFLRFNRAIAARVLAYRGSEECATCYADALDAIAESFLVESEAGMNTGVFHVFSSSAGDLENDMSREADADNVAHPSIVPDAEMQADGTTPDDRLTAKTVTIPVRRPASNEWATIGIETTVGFNVYPTRTTKMPIIRGEELLLLRAEARWFSNTDKAGAIADLNWIRTNIGGLLPSTLTVASTDAEFVTELLKQRRYSLLLEGHRWPDHRRFERLADLPRDLSTHFVAPVQPITQEECDIRKGTAVAHPSCL